MTTIDRTTIHHTTTIAPAADTREALLRWTAQLGAVTADALARRDREALASARARLVGAVRRGELASTRPLADAPALYTATRAGLRACGAGAHSPVRISAANAAHAIACVRVGVALELAYPDHVLLGEPELRALHAGRAPVFAPNCLAAALRALPPGHRPDLLLAAPAERAGAVAVEVELTVKSPRRLAAICRTWARCRSVAGAIYVAPPPVARAVERALTASAAEGRVTVVALDALEGDTAAAHTRTFADPIPRPA